MAHLAAAFEIGLAFGSAHKAAMATEMIQHLLETLCRSRRVDIPSLLPLYYKSGMDQL
jgi:hypothetical protein